MYGPDKKIEGHGTKRHCKARRRTEVVRERLALRWNMRVYMLFLEVSTGNPSSTDCQIMKAASNHALAAWEFIVSFDFPPMRTM